MSAVRPERRVTATTVVIAVLISTIAVAACTGGGGPSPSAGPVAYRATDLVSGADVSLADYRGRPVLMTSWAVWCTACIEELPALEVFWASHRDDIAVVAVNVDSSRQSAIRRMRSDGLTMPVWHDPGDAFSKVFKLVGIPSWVLLGPDGGIVRLGVGPIDFTDPNLLDGVGTALLSLHRPEHDEPSEEES